MKDVGKHKTLLTGMCAAVLLLVLAVGCQGTSPLVTHTVHFAVDGGNGTVHASVDDQVLTSPAQVEKGKKIIFTAEPAAGYMVENWNGISVATQNATNAEYTVTGDFNITVRFKPVPAEKYTVTIQKPTNGTVSVNPALPSDKKIGKDTELLFTAEPNEDYEIGVWTVTGGTILSGGRSGDKSVTVKVISDIAVKVEFKKKPVQNNPNPPVPGQPAPFIPEYVPVTEVVLHDVNDELIEEDTTLLVKLGEQFQLKPVIKPEKATNKEVEYTYEENLVSVTGTGLVTAIGKGIATVNIRVDGKKRTSIGFQIKNDSSVTFDKTEIRTDYTTGSAAVVITKKSDHSVYHCTVRYAYGNGNWVNWGTASNGLKDTITVNIEENKSAFERRAYLVFKTNTAKPTLIREIPIIQKVCPAPVLKTKWVEGISQPSDSELVHGGYNVNPKYGVWKETPTTTWFNAKKSQDKKDDQMCWAMSTADLLHWWMKQNEDNLKRVIRKKGILPDTDQYKLYLGEYNRSLLERKSGVANVFRKRFTNNVHGTALNSAVGWYLLGMTAGGELTPQYSTDPAPGIVKGIFSNLNDLIVPRYVHNKEEFENTIKDAFDEHNALAVQFILGNNAGLHVVTVWGVEFDADENITALWVSDSNDANSHLTKFGVHYPDGRPHKINYAVANDSGKTLITDVITMKNAKQQFKNWLDSNNY